MIETLLRSIFTSQWLVIIIVSALLLLAAESGFRIGLSLHHRKDEARKGQVGGVQGAILGLLGLLLGFTFAMAVGRYDARRSLVLTEANAIGTAYLRASLLPPAQQAPVEELLRKYVDARLGFYDAGENREKLAAAEQATAVIQRELWTHAVAAAKAEPTATVVSFINSLNDTLDCNASRLNALRTHVPGAVWMLVLAISICGCCVSGYAAGSSGARNGFSSFVLPLTIAVAITLIADLDRPRGGMIEISQQPMRDVRESLEPFVRP